MRLKDRYELEKELGRGGIGVVYLAHDTQLHSKLVVIKVLLEAVEASENKIGSPVDRVLLLCYAYDPNSGKYTPLAMGLLRLGAAITLLGLTAGLGLAWRREWSRVQSRQ